MARPAWVLRLVGPVASALPARSSSASRIVHELVKRGAYVAVLDMNVELGERIEMELKGLVIFVQCDVRSEADVVAAIARVDEKWAAKAVGGVIHCGGVAMVGKVRFCPIPHLRALRADAAR